MPVAQLGRIHRRVLTAYQTSQFTQSGVVGEGGGPSPGVVPHSQTLRQVAFKDGASV